MYKGKISLRQAIFIFLVLSFSPIIRYTTGFTAAKAKQAAWLAPLPSVIPLLIMIFILSSIYKKYKEKSMMEVIYDVLGIWVGKFIVFLYFLWSIGLIALYCRYYVERLVGTIYSTIPMSFFIIVTLMVIAYILPKGITVIGRMSEVFFIIIFFTFVLLFLFMIPNIRIDSVFPVSTKDLFPILKGSLVTTSVGTYLFLLFFMGEFINDKDKLLKKGINSIVFYTIFSSVLIFVVVGSLTSTVTQRIPIPFFVAVKLISILDTIEKIESVVIGIFVFADFILLTAMIFVCLNIMKSLFKLKETKHLLNIFLVLIYFLALGIALNRYELEIFSKDFIIYINITFGLLIPIILFIVGKIRKKI